MRLLLSAFLAVSALPAPAGAAAARLGSGAPSSASAPAVVSVGASPSLSSPAGEGASLSLNAAPLSAFATPVAPPSLEPRTLAGALEVQVRAEATVGAAPAPAPAASLAAPPTAPNASAERHQDGGDPAAPGEAAPTAQAALAKMDAAPAQAAALFNGGRYQRLGEMVVDTQAPGASELIESASRINGGGLIIGIFDPETDQVINGFAWDGPARVQYHKHALGAGLDPARVGGYTLIVPRDGPVRFKESGSLRKTITPSAKRAILRYFGLSRADETFWGRLGRAALYLADAAWAWVRLMGKGG
ncbi:MAG TPA: hypothetical protein VNI01_14415 [Elusimicrobiota bacterium]|nr:hypothetical protein [Elusimicrobiota bacterium]